MGVGADALDVVEVGETETAGLDAAAGDVCALLVLVSDGVLLQAESKAIRRTIEIEMGRRIFHLAADCSSPVVNPPSSIRLGH